MDCMVCGHPAMDRFIYCARCFKFIENTPQKLARRHAMKAAWNKHAGAFLCYYSGVKLEEYSTGSPFYMVFDHLVPGDNAKMAASARFINELKDAMTETEFRTNIPLLADHFRTGDPIDRGLFKVEHFHDKHKKRAARTGPLAFKEPLGDWRTDACGACGKPPAKASLYCTRCRKILLNQRTDWAAKVRAMREAYDRDADGFRCRYTGFLVDLKDMNSPWHFNFDHRFPGKPGDYNMSCYIINLMKSALSEDEFRKVVMELARHFETGAPYDRDIIRFEYWHRPKMVR